MRSEIRAKLAASGLPMTERELDRAAQFLGLVEQSGGDPTLAAGLIATSLGFPPSSPSPSHHAEGPENATQEG